VAASAGLAVSGGWLRGARGPGLSSSFVSSSSVQDAWLVGKNTYENLCHQRFAADEQR